MGARNLVGESDPEKQDWEDNVLILALHVTLVNLITHEQWCLWWLRLPDHFAIHLFTCGRPSKSLLLGVGNEAVDLGDLRRSQRVLGLGTPRKILFILVFEYRRWPTRSIFLVVSRLS